MIPVVALVGRQNVGKSTLFNRFTRTRDALVADFPGLTRDRKYGRAKWKGYEFIVIDTGGIDGAKDEMETRIVRQSLVAIDEADIVLFVVDGRDGLMDADKDIARHLFSREKPTVVVANKIDGIDVVSSLGDFYSLGISDVMPISASHGLGINSLLELILLPLASGGLAGLAYETETTKLGKDERFYLQSMPIKLAIVGRPNVGKSTLVNRILGEKRVIVYDMPGTTRENIYIPMLRDKREYVLIDTAGIRKRSNIMETMENFSVIKTLRAIEDANVVLLMIDAREGVSKQDLSILGFIINSGRSLVIAINKWDNLFSNRRNDIKEALDHRFGFINFARVHFISALHGSGVGDLFYSVNEAYESATKRVNTALLTRIMRKSVDDHQPPLVRGRRVKLKYAHAGGYNPPIFVIYGTQVKNLPDAYKRYLINYFRRSLDLMGTPIRLQFNEGANPFVQRCNFLTQKKLYKQKC